VQQGWWEQRGQWEQQGGGILLDRSIMAMVRGIESGPRRPRRGRRVIGGREELSVLSGEIYRMASDWHWHNWSHQRTVDDRSGNDDLCDRLEGTHFYGRRVIRPSL
jgi:hypothetical protein